MNKIVLIIMSLVLANSIVAQNYYRNWTVQHDSKKERIALIIANNNYMSSGRLDQPIPTAKKLETTLNRLGFDVLVGRDLNRKQMVSVINDFSNKYKNYEFALIAYMGHGFEIDGNNYLIPIDANPPSKDEVAIEAVNIEYVMGKINSPKIPKVIILDACRDNPFAYNWSSSDRSSSGNGFADISAPRNAEVFFTTQKHSKVRDDNPYMNYFMGELNKGGCLEDIVRTVSKKIYNYDSNQIPAKYGQLFDRVCFGTKATIDSDNDGFHDNVDNCPYKYSTVNNGCPKESIKDSDNDGFPDNIDNCPYKYSTVNNGCPLKKVDYTSYHQNLNYRNWFHDDFNSNQFYWSTGKGKFNTSQQIQDGKYIINVDKTGLVTTIPFNLNENANWEIEAKMHYDGQETYTPTFSISGSTKGWKPGVGIAWGTEKGTRKGYRFFLRDGDYSISKFDGEKYVGLNNIILGDDGGSYYNYRETYIQKWFKLTIRKIDNMYYFFLNEHFVMSSYFEPFQGDRIGFEINTFSKNNYVDYLTIKYIE